MHLTPTYGVITNVVPNESEIRGRTSGLSGRFFSSNLSLFALLCFDADRKKTVTKRETWRAGGSASCKYLWKPSRSVPLSILTSLNDLLCYNISQLFLSLPTLDIGLMLTSTIMVLLCNLALIRLSSKIDQLRVAEHRLLEYAKDFTPPSTSDENSRCQIRTIDTKIPQSAVPLKHHIDDMYRRDMTSSSNRIGAQTYVIHGVEVTSKNDDANTNKSKTPLVLLHGYMNGCLYFYRNLYGLSQYFESIYSLDLLGWGLSSRPRFAALRDSSREITEAFFVESLEAWRKAQRVDKMILAGHSMGGYISVAYAEKYPHHVERLILISPAGVPEQPQHQPPQQALKTAATQKMADLSLSLRRISRRVTKDLYTHIFHNYSLGDAIRSLASIFAMDRVRSYIKNRFTADCAKMSVKEQDALSRYLYWNNALPGSAEYCISRFLTPMVVFGQSPTVHRIPKLKVKSVAFLYGDKDWMDPVEGGWAVQRACLKKQQQSGDRSAAPDVTLRTISDAGHLLMLEHWQDFNRNLVLAAGLSLLPGDEKGVTSTTPTVSSSCAHRGSTHKTGGALFNTHGNVRVNRQVGMACAAHASLSSLPQNPPVGRKGALPRTIEHIHRIQMAI